MDTSTHTPGDRSRKANGHACGATPIALAGMEYAAHGWPLVLLSPKSKRAVTEAWNRRENVVTDVDAIARHRGNIGLALAFANVVSLDIDDFQGASDWLEARGINLTQLLMAPDALRVESGVPGRAKLLYRVPEGVAPLSLLTHKIHDGDRNVILELRCADTHGGTVQDVLPPSIHPDTGLPYRWRGNWRTLPVLPDALSALWQGFDNTTHPRGEHDDARGDGSGADFLAVVAKLEALGCKPKMTGPGDARAHCPVHHGQSGTTLHITEKADSTVLLYCHAGCPQDDVLASLDMGPGPEVRMGGGPHVEAHERAQRADTPEPAPNTLPPVPEALCALPCRLGEVQGWAMSTMLRPHAGVAGLAALALVDYLAMPRVRIASRSGLAMGEFFMVMAPSGFGKEALRMPFRKVAAYAARKGIALPDLHHSAPSSQQGLQEMLVANPCLAMLPDEFGDWIAKGAKEPHREQAMSHLMHVYGNPFGVVDVPRSLSNSLKPVQCPRVLLFATSTGERMVEVLNGSLADRGFLNRFVMLPIAGHEAPLAGDIFGAATDYEIPPVLRALVDDISSAPELLTIDADAREYSNAHFRAELARLEDDDNVLAGRLHEQSLRIAACLALADGRQNIGVRDVAMGYEIRQGLYVRTRAFFDDAGNLGDGHPTAIAYEQCRRLFERHQSMKRSRLVGLSRLYRRLPPRERNDIVRGLIADGIVYEREKRLFSLILNDKDDKKTT